MNLEEHPIGNYNLTKIIRRVGREYLSIPAYAFSGEDNEYERWVEVLERSNVTVSGTTCYTKCTIEITIDYG